MHEKCSNVTFFWSAFSHFRTESIYSGNLRIHPEYRKVQTRKIYVFRHSSQSETVKNWQFFYHFLTCNFYRNGLGLDTYLPEVSYEEYPLVKSIRFT